ncbi:hypothetical protein H0H87_009938 [Tephrocybe sp. NHM501043]|nr:hypothetical protein H0H87_009938 [Tephrocybe sp. NHM501043]
MSEGDSLSDSDWLDIASNRESDDNDSVLSGDSDGEDVGMVPLSRRSSISVGSSRDGDVDAWEGLAYESGDEGAQSAEFAMTTPLSTAEMVTSPMAASHATVASTHDLIEEQRVNEALDQSMMSTLSASRSSTASAHASLRDLRLSFPDPLTSQDELNRSYEDVPTSDATLDDIDIPTSTDDNGETDSLTASLALLEREEDPGPFITTPAVTTQPVEAEKFLFDVVLYGSSSSIKWSFAASLIEQAYLPSGLKLAGGEAPGSDRIVRYLQFWTKNDFLPIVVPVLDRTNNPRVAAPSCQALAKRPSLAIVYLPSAVRTFSDHTLYLPVLVPSSPTESEMSRSIAISDWNDMSIPSDRVAHLDINATNPIIDGSDEMAIRDIRAYQLLQRLLSAAKKRPTKVVSDHISPAQAVTLFALMSLIVGFAMNTTFRKSATPTPTAATPSPVSTFWGIFGPEVNQTSVIGTTIRANTPIMTSHKESSLSIDSPSTTSLVISTDSKSPAPRSSTTPHVAGFHCRPSTGADRIKSSKDIAVAPGPGTQVAASAEAGPSTVTVVRSGEAQVGSGPKTTALSLVVDTLSEAIDARVAWIRKDYRVDELIESLDELARAIRRQTLRKVDNGKGKAREIRDRVQHRHERARGNAKKLKKKGEEIIYLASGEFVERTNVAKKRARDILKKGEEISYIASDEFVERTKLAKKKAHDILKKKGEEIIQLASGEFAEKTHFAKKKASDLIKRTGEEIIYLAGGELVQRTNMAKKKARDITINLANSESWRTYQKIHADWVELLKEKGEESQGLRKGKQGKKGKCRKMKSNGPSSLFSRSLADYYLL